MLDVTPIPAFTDNYIWCLTRPGHSGAVVVDPGDGEAVLAALEKRQLVLEGVLITHHHFDHTGGLDRLLEHTPVPVYGPANPQIPQVSTQLREGDHIEVLGVDWEVIEVPGHTLDHIAFFGTPEGGEPCLFCGDTLFAGGCGRLFEGNPAMMVQSLDKLARLPGATRVFCAHEYTMANLAFAAAVEPGNAALQSRIEHDQGRRDDDLPTVPSTVALELATNPFLRCAEADVAAQMQSRDNVDPEDTVAVFAAVRGWKDNF